MNDIPVMGCARYQSSQSRMIIGEICSILSVNSSNAPALCPASALQLALNLFDFPCIPCSDCELTGEDYVQHVNECVCRNVHQFPEHRLLPWSNLKIALVFAIRLPEVARCKWMKIPVYQLDRNLVTQTSDDLPRALTEFGQQAEVSLGRQPVLGVAINQPAIALLRLFGGRLLNLNGGNPIRLRRIDRDYAKAAVRVARTNGYRGLFSRRRGHHLIVDQYRHAKTCAGVAGIGLFHCLFGCSLTCGTRALGAGCALNGVQVAVPGGPRDIDGIGFYAVALFSGSASRIPGSPHETLRLACLPRQAEDPLLDDALIRFLLRDVFRISLTCQFPLRSGSHVDFSVSTVSPRLACELRVS